jgi:citrate lyase subunit beta/citryl-CoA lyase
MSGPHAAVPRALLSIPAGDARKLDKALASDADELILDLEDAVAPAQKRAALDSLLGHDFSGTRKQLNVRVNAPRSPWCHTELAALSADGLPFHAVLVPKVESAGDLHFVDRLLDSAEHASGRTASLEIHALIESAAGVQTLPTFAAASPRLTRLVIGYADLAASLGRQADQSWRFHQDSVLTAAHAAGLLAIDGPYLGVDSGETFRASVETAAGLGFDGKWVIHPRQVPAVNERFTPTSDQIDNARKIVDALAAAHAGGRGAVALNGKMIDEAVAVAARRVLARISVSLPPGVLS